MAGQLGSAGILYVPLNGNTGIVSADGRREGAAIVPDSAKGERVNRLSRLSFRWPAIPDPRPPFRRCFANRAGYLGIGRAQNHSLQSRRAMCSRAHQTAKRIFFIAKMAR